MKKYLTWLGFFALLAFGVASVGVQALPIGTVAYEDTYYSDATYTEVVGERWMQCDSSPGHWGIITLYRQSFEWDCNTQESIDICPSTIWLCADYNPPGDYRGCTCM
jgi:hypothetical protein